jgi:quinoprotein glucose dehydrogenase
LNHFGRSKRGPSKVRRVLGTTVFMGVVAVFSGRLSASDRLIDDANWPDYQGGEESPQYSPLKQIDKTNVKDLELAWFYPVNAKGLFGFNPVIVDGVMYLLGKDHTIVALNAATGSQIWSHPAESFVTSRGINYWESKDRSDRRLIFSANNYLQEIDARTGLTIPSFGSNGRVNLREGLGRDPNSFVTIQSGTPGRIFENLIILGSSTGEEYGSPPGDIRAFDILTGKIAWSFHTIPHPGEFGYETWPPEAWKYAGGVNDWGGMTLDEKRGIVFVPTGSSTYDFYGADRTGADLFADCLLALDARTGKRLWHFQFVHHDLWDYDAATAPKLLTVRHDGKMVDVVAQATKQGFLFVFQRETGEPLWPIEERSVPRSEMPQEHAWPTQPFPTKPPPFARQTFAVADVNPLVTDPADLARLKEWVSGARNEGLFTPAGLKDTMEVPGNSGGANWGAAATDPATGMIFVQSKDAPSMLKLVGERPRSVFSAPPAAQGRDFYRDHCQTCHGVDRNGHGGVAPSLVDAPQRLGAGGITATVRSGRGGMPSFPQSGLSDEDLAAIIAFLSDPAAADVPFHGKPSVPGPDSPDAKYWSGYGTIDAANGLPGISPPWSSLTAYDLNEGVIKWKIPLGTVPSLAAKGIKPTGSYWPRGGPVATAGGLIFVGTGSDLTLHAYDKDSGNILWERQLASAPEGIPAVYEADGREYVIFCTRAGEALDNLPVNPNQVVQAVGSTENQGYYVFALPKSDQLKPAKKK